MEENLDQIDILTREINRKLEAASDRWNEYLLSFAASLSTVLCGGRPLLPPVMNAERRLEMLTYRRQANIAAARLKVRRRERNSLPSSSPSATDSSDSSGAARQYWTAGNSSHIDAQDVPKEVYLLLQEPAASCNAFHKSADSHQRTIVLAEPSSDESCNDLTFSDSIEQERYSDSTCSIPVLDLEARHWGPCGLNEMECEDYNNRLRGCPEGRTRHTSSSVRLSTCQGDSCGTFLRNKSNAKNDPLSLLSHLDSDSPGDSDAESSVSDTFFSLPSARAQRASCTALNATAPKSPCLAAYPAVTTPPSSPAARLSTGSHAPGDMHQLMSPLVRRNSYTLEHPSPALLRSRVLSERHDHAEGDKLHPDTWPSQELVNDIPLSTQENAAVILKPLPHSLHSAVADGSCQVADIEDDEEEAVCEAVLKQDLALLKSKHSRRLVSSCVDSAAATSSTAMPSSAATPACASLGKDAWRSCRRHTVCHVLEQKQIPIEAEQKSRCFERLAGCIRGYLTRRLMKTAKVVVMCKTIKDCLHLHEEGNKATCSLLRPSDINFQKRVESELAMARRRLHELFFAPSSASERAKLLSQAVAARRNCDHAYNRKSGDGAMHSKRHRSQGAKAYISSVTVKVIERKRCQKKLLPAHEPKHAGMFTNGTAVSCSLPLPGHQLSVAATGLLEQRED